MNTIINKFNGPYKFLSNFFDAPQIIKGIKYRCNENFFQAMKTFDTNVHKLIAPLQPNKAKKFGKSLQLRSDWDTLKNNFMLIGVLHKFQQNNHLSNKLKATGKILLVEGNQQHDNYWGNCNCNKCKNIVGKNKLGEILMIVRHILNSDYKKI